MVLKPAHRRPMELLRRKFMASVGFPDRMPSRVPHSSPGLSHSGSPALAGFGGRPAIAAGGRAKAAAGRRVWPAAAVRRRPTMEQGRGLEMLSRAVEYLVDSCMMQGAQPEVRLSRPDSEAVRILMRLNREVFSECKEVVPIGQRLRQWALGWRAAA